MEHTVVLYIIGAAEVYRSVTTTSYSILYIIGVAAAAA